MPVKNLPIHCPACASRLTVRQLQCTECQTAVSGDFSIPLLLQISVEEQDFLLKFLKSSGSLKSMAKQLGYSYPKVRNMLDDLINKIDELQNNIEENDR